MPNGGVDDGLIYQLFTNITRKKFHRNLQQIISLAFGKYSPIHIFRIRIKLRRYKWTKVLLR